MGGTRQRGCRVVGGCPDLKPGPAPVKDWRGGGGPEPQSAVLAVAASPPRLPVNLGHPVCSGLGDHSNGVARGLAAAASAAEALIWSRLQVKVPTLPGNPPTGLHGYSSYRLPICSCVFRWSQAPTPRAAISVPNGSQLSPTIPNSPQRSPTVPNRCQVHFQSHF